MLEWVDEGGGVVVVSVPARVDVSNTRALVDVVVARVDAGLDRVVLDFEHTQMIDSTALGALVQILKSLGPRGGSLALAHVGESIHRLFSLTRLDGVFTLVPTRAEAVALLRPKA